MTKLKLKKWKSYPKSKKRGITVGLIIAAILISIGTLFFIDAFAIAPKTGPATVQVLDIGDDNKDVSEKAKVTVFEKNIAGMTVDELSDLKYDDYKRIVDETTADKVDFFIDENHIYKMKVVYRNSVRWYNPEPGENVILMVRKTSSVVLLMRDDVSYNSTYLGNTLLGYDLELIAADDDEGFMPGYLFNEDDVNLIWICFNFTRVAQENFAKVDSYYNEKIVSGTKLYIGITGFVVGKTEYDVTFGTGKAETYDVNNIGYFFGLEKDIIPVWMD